MSEIGSDSEVRETSEVNEAPANETGGEASAETQEAAEQEAAETGGFDDMDDVESTEEDPEESDMESEEESDDSDGVGFSEDEETPEAAAEADAAEEDPEPADEDRVGFDDPEESDQDSDVSEEEADADDEDEPEGQADEDLPQETEDDSSDVSDEENPEDGEEDNPEAAEEPEDYPEEASDETAEDAPEDEPEEASDVTDEENPEETPEDETEEDLPEEDPETAEEPEDYPTDDPNEDPEVTADKTPEDYPEEASDVTDEENPEETSEDETEEDLPEEEPDTAEEPEDDPEEDPEVTADETPEDDSEAETDEDADIADEESEDDADTEAEPDDADEDPESDDESADAYEEEYEEDYEEEYEEDPGEEEVYDDDSQEDSGNTESESTEEEESDLEAATEEAADQAEQEAVDEAADRVVDEEAGQAEDENRRASEESAPDSAVNPDEAVSDGADEGAETADQEAATEQTESDAPAAESEDDEDEDPYSGDYDEEEPDEGEPEQYGEDADHDLKEGSAQEASPTGTDTVDEASKDKTAERTPEGAENSDAYREAMDKMSAYMNEHNYGKDDYDKYSQDPQWQELNAQLKESMGAQESSPEADPYKAAMDNMSQYMNSHNYGKMDYPEYSQDPQWQKLNADLQKAEGIEPVESKTAELSTAMDNMREYMYSHNYGKMDYPEYSQDPEWQKLNADLQESLGIEVPKEPDGAANEVPPAEAPETAPEISEKETVDPTERIEGMAYSQGNNELGYQGTCGPTSLANSLNRVLDTDRFTEDSMVKTANAENLCAKYGPPEACGGTGTENIVQLSDRVLTPEDHVTTEVYEYDKALSVEELAEKLKDPDTVAMVGVDSATLWDECGPADAASGMYARPEVEPSDHWIMVDQPVYGEDGELKGFRIVDSGGGESYASREKFEAMYTGTPDHRVEDPTSILFSKSDAPVQGGDPELKPKTETDNPDKGRTEDTDRLDDPEKAAQKTTEGAGEIPQKDISEMPENVRNSFDRYEKAGWPETPRLPEQAPGTKADGVWQNRGGDLPTKTADGTPISYREHDVNDKIPGQNRDGQRFVTGSDGSVYYTDDHYSTFNKLR